MFPSILIAFAEIKTGEPICLILKENMYSNSNLHSLSDE